MAQFGVELPPESDREFIREHHPDLETMVRDGLQLAFRKTIRDFHIRMQDRRSTLQEMECRNQIPFIAFSLTYLEHDGGSDYGIGKRAYRLDQRLQSPHYGIRCNRRLRQNPDDQYPTSV